MKTEDSGTKRWKVVIPVIIIALFVGWYWFRPERLVTNRRVHEGFPTINDSSTHTLSRLFFIAARTPPREPQRSIASRVGAEFSVHELQDI